MSGQNRTDYELKQLIANLPVGVRSQMYEILQEMANGSTRRDFYCDTLAATTDVTVAGVSLTGGELGVLDGVTAGTVTASKAVVVDANEAIDAITITDLKLGASGAGASVTATAAELNLLDGSSSANDAASVAAVLDANGYLQTASATHSVTDPVAGTSTTVTYGTGWRNTTVVTLADVALTVGDNAALATGAELFSFPAGRVVIESAYMNVYLASQDATIQADTPDLGLGTAVAVGAYATLQAVDAGETITTENIITGQTMADVNGTNTIAYATPALITDAIAKVYLNVADTWGDGESTAVTASGTVVIHWSYLS